MTFLRSIHTHSINTFCDCGPLFLVVSIWQGEILCGLVLIQLHNFLVNFVVGLRSASLLPSEETLVLHNLTHPPVNVCHSGRAVPIHGRCITDIGKVRMPQQIPGGWALVRVQVHEALHKVHGVSIDFREGRSQRKHWELRLVSELLPDVVTLHQLRRRLPKQVYGQVEHGQLPRRGVILAVESEAASSVQFIGILTHQDTKHQHSNRKHFCLNSPLPGDVPTLPIMLRGIRLMPLRTFVSIDFMPIDRKHFGGWIVCESFPQVEELDPAPLPLEEHVLGTHVAVKDKVFVEVMDADDQIQEEHSHIIAGHLRSPAPQVCNRASLPIQYFHYNIAVPRVVSNWQHVLHLYNTA
mmetsp:Transcript_34098/g.96654  ORF Transcript_34098/g.96654 Transcript_34098/m.96654 type:complete len:353 (-) Transcript_34098:691-1749(-)